MFINENNLRNNAEYLFNEYEIIFAPERDEELAWWIPDAAANTTEDYNDLICYQALETSLRVSAGDELIVDLIETTKEGYLFELYNLNNNDSVFIEYQTDLGLWEEERYEIIMNIASGLKHIPNVTVQYFLTYTDEQVLFYLEEQSMFEEII